MIPAKKITESNAVEQFRLAMAMAGLPYSGDIIPDNDKINRFTVDGDRKKSLTGWYTLHTDGVPAGEFGCWKRDIRQTWCAKAENTLSHEELADLYRKRQADKARREAELTAKHAAAEAKANAIWEAASPCTEHPYLSRKGVPSYGLRVSRWTKTDNDGEVWLDIPNALLVPVRIGRRITSLQAIFPEKSKKSGRDKDFLSGGRKSGGCFVIGEAPSPANKSPTLVVCEGYSTGATIYQATGWTVIVAFDAGNLERVATKVREKFPHARLVIAADNDRWTDLPVKNPGIVNATRAAQACRGDLVIPEFSCLDEKPTDFNDLARLEGLDAVRRFFQPDMSRSEDEAIEIPSAPANDNIGPVIATHEDAEEEDGTVRGASPYNYFTILGYNREEFFIFQHEKRQLMVINSGAFSSNKFIELAPFEVWCIAFPAKGGFDKSAAFNDLVRKAHSMPVFNPARIRGRGAWIDSNRHLFHFGNHMLIDGKKATIGRFASRYIYQAEVPFEIDLSVPPLTADEGGKLLMLASKFRWTMPASAALLAGWTAIAPLCGAMRWRPHIWLTGGAGCGKTTVLKAFVHQLTGWCDVFAQGNSTEAGIRQTLGCDAVPVLFDESEQNNEREATRVQNILALIRQASTESEAKTLKGTATGNTMNFHIRSMFCLASIQVGIQQQADAERMTVLSLRTKPEKGSPEEAQSRKDWEELKEDLYLLERDETLPARLFKRMVQRLPMLMQSIDVFVVAAARHFGNQREGDQYGTLLAGCWCLVSDELPTQEDAAAMIAEFDWNDYAIGAKVDDATRAFNALLEARIRTPHGSEYSVFELCDRIASIQGVRRKNGEEAPVCQLEMKDAQATLQRYGMKVSKNGKLMLSNSSDGLVRLMAGTPFQADFRGLVSRVQGVESRGEVVWINGSSCRCMAIPLTLIV